ncbi:MAG: large subunit ribosomal protein L18e [Candidatus Woesearchaeota archaeon]|nr:large subunit ribosomal protein L18e [Candidatus Woesearchaeota archaeon]MDN5327732.1 large subunit ribosomal protein L18e [Candidatus Woesearchaeota archaeon]
MRTGPTNPILRGLISDLKRIANERQEAVWRKVAEDLSRPSRIRREVNLSRINRFTKEGDFVVVPGKVLSLGELDHKVTIVAWAFSGKALEKIKNSGSKAYLLVDYVKGIGKAKKVANIKVIG